MGNVLKLIKKYWWFIAMLVVAGLFTIFKPQYSSIRSSETRFAITDTSEITRIEIAGKGNKIELSRANNGWIVNENDKAQHKPVFLLLTVLSRMNATSPIPISIADSIMNDIEENGKVVTIYSGRKKVMQFAIYFTEAFNIRTVGWLKGANTAYKLGAPLVGRDIIDFFSADISYWIDTRTKMANFETLFGIEVEIPSNPEKSFRIDLQNPKKPNLIALYYNHSSSAYDTVSMNRFLSGVETMAFDAKPIALTPETESEIRFAEPDYIFTFYNKNKEPLIFSFIPIAVDEYIDELGRPVQFDLNRMYLSTNIDAKLFEIKFIDFAPVLKDITYFKPKFKKQ